ncbi:uncharacterized protein tnfsf11 isoform X2 [Tachysurus vachellii]|uniref:uncharacterized protein tnfsf11 isoform X2 n=1 Tax=Tachysurus vachellii TaxID=175792 RepID=UPI00296AAC1E|nr:uncharacterized protein tnfsf11 isoform X2 [Tachysurus vachellii]
MAANDYHGYLRNHMDMENGGSRFQPPTQSAHKPLIFGTLAVMGLLQVASSVTILLHLTGYLREVDLSSARPIEEVHSEPIIAGAFRDIKKKEKPRKKDQTPIAHLSVKTPMDFASTDSKVVTTIHWNQYHGTLMKVNYHEGRFVMKEQGLYYVYCKTCFRVAGRSTGVTQTTTCTVCNKEEVSGWEKAMAFLSTCPIHGSWIQNLRGLTLVFLK